MKNLIMFVLVTFLVSCQKQEIRPEFLEGTWELRHILGVQVAGAPSDFEKGNGNIIEFTENRYKKIENGQVLAQGTYTIVQESAEIDGIKYENRIVFDNDTWKVFIKISGNRLFISTGSIASDGTTSTYEKLK